MRRTVIAMALATAMTLAVAPAALASGQTAGGAEDRGLTCFNAGPDNWIHCIDAGRVGAPGFFVMIFSEDGDVYLGTERLVRSDKYNGDPCLEDNLDVWDGPLGPDLDGDGEGDYFACHLFDTGRN
jgi:hypothetical protein